MRRQLAALGHHPRKRLGQHFLSDPLVAERIITMANAAPNEPIVEIGPGLGILSDLLAARPSPLFLVELDASLAAHLAERYRTAAHVRVVHADALSADFGELLAGLAPAVALGNLPYNVATPILARLLEQRDLFRRLVVMLQREVAARLAAEPGSRTYGALSVLTQLYCDVHIAMHVGAGAFVPAPQVDSAVVVLDVLHQPRVDLPDPARFHRMVRGLFQHRRKQLGNSARGIFDDPRAALAAAGIDPQRRPETLSIDEFARLAREER